MKILPVTADLFHVDGRTDRRMDRRRDKGHDKAKRRFFLRVTRTHLNVITNVWTEFGGGRDLLQGTIPVLG
jgi:hypothetical protein